MRRRPFRRPFRGNRPQRVPPALRRANQLMETGNYPEAALAFEKIASRTEVRRGARAPIFHLRAGRAYILANDVIKGMPHLKRGLSALAAKHQWEPLHRFGQRAVDELKELNLNQEADEVAAFLADKLPENAREQKADSHPALPIQCPACGAPLRLDEVMWIDQDTAECAFCGNPVRGED